jgi:hypothetical protein
MPMRLRLRATAVLTALITGAAVLAVPGAASAAPFGPQIPCPTDPGIVWKKELAQPHIVVWAGYRYSVYSATLRFGASDGRVVDNTFDFPVEATFTSQQSQRFAISVTVGSSTQFGEQLRTEVSTNIVMERTTAIGVNASFTVPPRTRVTGLYGMEVYDISYTAQKVWSLLSRSKCYDQGTVSGSTVAPTIVEGWRFIAG